MKESERQNILEGLKIRQRKLAQKINELTREIVSLPKQYPGGQAAHWKRAAKNSLIATRKKMYELEERIKTLKNAKVDYVDSL